MAASRRSASNSADAHEPVFAAVDQALAAIGRDAGDLEPSRVSRLAVAFSGGLDSTVLLHACIQRLGADRVVALHVAHGLQAAARDWPAHCAAVAGEWGVAIETLVLGERPGPGQSVEQWARRSRYRALVDACERLGSVRLWTAHHADDQLETIWLRLLRGAGVDGLTGIAARRPLGERVGLERPLLDLPRALLVAHAKRHALRWVEDPTNRALSHPRNAIRHELLPVVDRLMPGWRAVMARNVAHWDASAGLLADVAREDLGTARDLRSPAVLDRRPLRALPPARRAGAWRAWLAEQGVRAPETARYAQMDRQLLLGDSPQARVDHDGFAWLRDHDRVTGVPLQLLDGLVDEAAAVRLRLVPGRHSLGERQGWLRVDESRVDGSGVDPRGGPAADGSFDARVLTGREARVAFGAFGAHRWRAREDGPSRTLKQWYQQHRVPPWLRAAMPVVFVDDQVLFSGAFGPDRSGRWQGGHLARAPATASIRWTLTWEPDPAWEGPLHAGGYPWGRPV